MQCAHPLATASGYRKIEKIRRSVANATSRRYYLGRMYLVLTNHYGACWSVELMHTLFVEKPPETVFSSQTAGKLRFQVKHLGAWMHQVYLLLARTASSSRRCGVRFDRKPQMPVTSKATLGFEMVR